MSSNAAGDSKLDGLQRLSDHENLALGTTTGVLEQLCTQPLLFWKNSFQQGRPMSLNPRVLYRGTGVSCINFASLTGLQFLSSGAIQKAITSGTERSLSKSEEVFAGFWEQQNFGGTMIGTPRRIAKQHGLTGLMRGITPSTGREAFYTAGYLGILPVTHKLVQERYPGVNPFVSEILGSVTAGLLCAFLSQPFDTAKTCMQGDVEKKKYGNTLETLKQLKLEYKSIGAFYRGYWWRALYVIVDFFSINFISTRIGPYMFPSKFEG